MMGSAVAKLPWGNADTMRAMHWATQALPLSTCLAIWAIGTTATVEAAWLATLHRLLGVLVLVFTVVRFVGRQHVPASSNFAQGPAVRRYAARASIVVLYGLLVVQPLLSVAGIMLRGDRVTVFGSIALPSLFPANQPLAHRVSDLQGWNALLLLMLIGMHIAAALYQHRIRRGEARPGLIAAGNARVLGKAAALGASAPANRT